MKVSPTHNIDPNYLNNLELYKAVKLLGNGEQEDILSEGKLITFGSIDVGHRWLYRNIKEYSMRPEIYVVVRCGG